MALRLVERLSSWAATARWTVMGGALLGCATLVMLTRRKWRALLCLAVRRALRRGLTTRRHRPPPPPPIYDSDDEEAPDGKRADKMA